MHVPNKKNEVDLTTLALAEVETVKERSKMVVQMTESMARKVATPVHKQSRLSKVSEERSSLLLGDWKFEMEVRTNGTTVGTVDRVNFYL